MGVEGDYKPRMAESWEISKDLKTWTWHLRKGIQFHRGFGEFTAKDLLYSRNQLLRPGSASNRTAFYKKLLEENRIVIKDDYTVVYNLVAPKIDLQNFSENDSLWGMQILSKAHFDAEGQKGRDENPVGTGPYQYVERVLGSHVLYQRVPYKHYRVTPDFPEVQIFKVAEHSTRLAMLLAGEAHIVMLPRDLEPTAIDRGMRVIPSTIPSVPVYTMFGGNFHPDGTIPKEGSMREGTYPDLPYSDVFHPVTEVPWVHAKVREALNRAVDREQIRKTIFHGQGEFMPVAFYHSSLPGWNQEWIDNFQKNYGYNPQRARELLKEVEAEIGQPLDWSKVIFLLTIRPELPELADLSEAVQNYWKAIGANVKLETREFSYFLDRGILGRTGGVGGVAWTDATLRFQDPRILEVIYYSKNGICCDFFERAFIDETFEKLVGDPDLARRDQLLREAGNYIYKEYGTLPMFWFFANFTVNPKVVADYRSAGEFPPRDLEDVVAVRK
jgi:ABC-type transport system substrate-binding protein